MKVVDGHFVYTGGSLPDSINKEDIKTVEVAATVTEIATKALMACVNLLTVAFTSPSSVTTIKEAAFKGCTAMATFNPSSLSNRRRSWTALNL